MKYVISTIVSLAMFVGVTWAFSEAAMQCGAPNAASKFVKRAVQETLKAPSTAQFQNVQAHPDGECTYVVVGRVSAENGFGASVQNTFSAMIDFQTGSNDYRVYDVMLSN